jgi:D-glycero-D-manno-heptose 1,7-bisphosphate phosphatase
LEKLKKPPKGQNDIVKDEPYSSAMHFLSPNKTSKNVLKDSGRDKLNPCIFLDRDGTINVEIEYLHEPSKFKFIPGVLTALRSFSDQGYRLIIITNQGAIHRGWYTHDDVRATHEFMISELKKEGIWLEGIYYCPHSSDEKCDCRKPSPGLILQAAKDHQIDLKRSWMIGDKLSDVEAGNRAGNKTILVLTGYGRENKEKLDALDKSELKIKRPTFIVNDLLDASEKIKQNR